MRSRRDPFARASYVPTRQKHGTCQWCGTDHRVFAVRQESDGGRSSNIGEFCSWSCAETYHDQRIAR